MLLTPYVMKLLEATLVTGIREAEFWEMTVGEAVRACDAYQDRRRDTAYFAFTNAMAVGLFVSSMFGSKAPPTLHDIYPEFFDEEDEEAEQTVKDSKSVANFINFANAFNRNFDNGDRKSESENNG